MKRRDLIKGLSLIPVASIGANNKVLQFFSSEEDTEKKIDYFEELGITKVINAGATMTFLSGSLMLPEVIEAINSTAHDFANMYELQDKVGAKIAEILDCEAAMVTSGAACALVLGTAAAITGTDKDKIKTLPNFSGDRPEVIMQKNHRYVFDQAITTTGAKIVEVESAHEMSRAINENTVMALFFNAAVDWFGTEDKISREEFVAICQEHHIPSFIDAAADVPPEDNLFKFQRMGFDLVTFSGGKMIRGPQSAGLLLGRKDLIEAAKLNHSPYEAPIGRPMKVNKEEIFGMYAALKSYIERDHKKEWQGWLDRIAQIRAHIESITSVKGEVHVPTGRSNAVPSLHVTWNEDVIKISPKKVSEILKEGKPSIISGSGKSEGKAFLNIGVVLLRSDQVDFVANRIVEILKKANI